jgi:hypothetical protein
VLGPVMYGNSQYVTLSSNGYIYTSLDGKTWALKRQGGTDLNLQSITYGNDLFVAVGVGDTIVTSKADAIGVIAAKSHTTDNSPLKINVAHNNISALLPPATRQGPLTVELFTIAGARIYSAAVKVHNGKVNIPAAGFPTGLYFLKIMGNNSTSMATRFTMTR